MWAQLASAGANLLGGFLNRDAQKEANQTNALNAAQNRQDQIDFARHGIEWRMEDAKRAGIHPVHALGAPGMSFSPVSVGATAETGVGTGLQSMGQDISRSVAAYRSPADKVNGVQIAQQQASNTLDLETKTLNNQLLRAKLANLTQPGTPPGVPFDVPESKKIEENPKLMLGGTRWDTNPNTSPMKAFEDRYGDEGPVAAVAPLLVLEQDLRKNFGDPATWPGQMGRWLAQSLWDDFRQEGQNAKRFLKDGSSVTPRRARPRGYY